MEPECATRFEEAEGADDVGGDEVSRSADRTIDMRFSSEVHDVSDLVIADDATDGFAVPEIHFLENVVLSAVDVREICEMSRVGEAIEIYQPSDCGLIDDVANEIGADEAGAARDQ